MNIQKNITQYNRNVKNNRTIKFIVIHAVGAVSTAKNNAKYYASKKLNASAHYFCDDTSIWQSVEDKDIAWHCGTSSGFKQIHPFARNDNSIGIEMCQNTTTTVSNATIANTAALVTYLMKKYNIPKDNVIRHGDVVNKKCPIMYQDTNKWNELKNIITGTSSTPAAIETIAAGNSPKSNSVIARGQQHANNFVQCGLVADGIRGANTKKCSVRVLQKALNLDYKSGIKEDGIFGTLSTKALGNHTVRKGEKQYMVTALEILLMLKGYDPNGVELPGVFGNGLDSALRKYQSENGLSVDGIAGPKTFMSLIS